MVFSGWDPYFLDMFCLCQSENFSCPISYMLFIIICTRIVEVNKVIHLKKKFCNFCADLGDIIMLTQMSFFEKKKRKKNILDLLLPRTAYLEDVLV